VKILKYLTLSLFAYIVMPIIVGGHWNQLVIASIVPHVEITPAFAMMLVAIFGTTISPLPIFRQASEEVEDIADHKKGDIGKGKQPHIAKKEIRLMRKDTAIDMAFSQIIMWAIITTTAGTLHIHGITDIQSAD
jgi:Mn2+/Fe2+ NRAMP family transporter